MFKTSIIGLLRNRAGASAIEYGLIVALVGVLVVAALDRVGSSVSQTMMTASDSLKSR
jgi:Flp pilus assembly pilin Flp